MSIIDVRIDRLVLRDVPAEYADGFAEAVERHLGLLAAGTAASPRSALARSGVVRSGVVHSGEALAAHVAREVWSAVASARPGGAP